MAARRQPVRHELAEVEQAGRALEDRVDVPGVGVQVAGRAVGGEQLDRAAQEASVLPAGLGHVRVGADGLVPAARSPPSFTAVIGNAPGSAKDTLTSRRHAWAAHAGIKK